MSCLKKLSCLVVVLVLAVPASADLVMHLEFDNASQIGEATVGDNLMAVGDAQYTAAGINGGGLLLDGDGDYLQLDGSMSLPSGIPTGNSSFTVAAYFKTTNGGVGTDDASGKNAIAGWGVSGTGHINGTRTGYFAGGEDFHEHIQNYSWGPGNDCVSSEVAFADGDWHHIAAVYDSASLTKVLYFDGIEVGSLTLAAPLNVSAENFLVGSIYYVYNTAPTQEYFTGVLDDVRIYNSVITEAEAAEIRAVAQPVPEPSVLLSLLALVSSGMLVWRRR